MKKLVITIITLYSLISCDNRKIYLEEISPLPKATILINGNQANKDSVKLTLKSGKDKSNFQLHIEGNKVVKNVSSKIIGGVGILSNYSESLQNGSTNLTFKPTSMGSCLIVFEITDNMGKKTEAKFEVVSFNNLLPTAQFTIDDKNVLSKLEKRINASDSYDKDNSYGGFIKIYEYSINGKIIKTDKPYIDWIFGSAGNYTIELTVTDNDGGISKISKVVKIE